MTPRTSPSSATTSRSWKGTREPFRAAAARAASPRCRRSSTARSAAAGGAWRWHAASGKARRAARRILSADKGEGRGYTMRTLRGAEWRYTLAQARVGRPTTPSPMTLAVDLQALAPCDSLYVSPHHDDVPLSCAARLLADAARGLRILVVTVFG